MDRHRHLHSNRRGQQGFILALGLLMLAALALIGTAALSTSSFQKDLANNSRVTQEVYYASTVGLGQALQQMTYARPKRNVMTLTNSPVYLVGGYNLKTGGIISGVDACDPNSTSFYQCICATVPKRCIAYYVEVVFKNGGNAPPRWGIGQYRTWYYQVVSTAQGYQGNVSQVSVYAASVYQTPYGYGGSGGGGS